MQSVRTMARAVVVAGLVVLAGGCASSGGGTPINDEPVMGEELAPYNNVYRALEQLRPRWLRQAREVFVDGNLQGGTSALRRIIEQPVQYVELVPGREVIRRFGPCQAPPGTGVLDTPRDPQCGTRPVIHVVIYTSGQ